MEALSIMTTLRGPWPSKEKEWVPPASVQSPEGVTIYCSLRNVGIPTPSVDRMLIAEYLVPLNFREKLVESDPWYHTRTFAVHFSDHTLSSQSEHRVGSKTIMTLAMNSARLQSVIWRATCFILWRVIPNRLRHLQIVDSCTQCPETFVYMWLQYCKLATKKSLLHSIFIATENLYANGTGHYIVHSIACFEDKHFAF